MNAVDLDYRHILSNFDNIPIKVADDVSLFLSESTLGHRYLLGRNSHSLILSKTVEISGFVDDYVAVGSLWEGKPVIKISDLTIYDIVINCSLSISPVTALNRLLSSKSRVVLNYSDLCKVRPDLFVLPDFVLATRSDFKVNEKRILSLYENFADEESCRVMRAVIGYRLTADPTYMRSFQVRFSDQYFEPFFDLYDPIFIDAGGYDGETTAEFCRRFPKYRKVYIFEPSEKNINLAQVKLSNLHNIEYIDKGLSDVADSVWFNADAGSASAIATSGSEKIDVIPLDLYPTEKLSFIKMDLEGWELPALHGARNHILKDFPVLAISAYHKASDFWQIFEYVYSLHSDYKVYLRHYTEGWSESVIFFVPGKN